jgi:hypothetical protein
MEQHATRESAHLSIGSKSGTGSWFDRVGVWGSNPHEPTNRTAEQAAEDKRQGKQLDDGLFIISLADTIAKRSKNRWYLKEEAEK